MIRDVPPFSRGMLGSPPRDGEVCVSIFARASGINPVTVPLASVLEDIRRGRYARQIQQLRQTLAVDRARYDRDKTKLPAFTISGTAVNRNQLRQHSNLVQVDLDKLGDELSPIRDRVKDDPHVSFGFVSPSGQGLKLGVAIDGTRHLESFHAAEAYFANRYDLRIDPQCKDVLRLCFVSYDPDLWINDDPAVLPLAKLKQGEVVREDSSGSCVLDNCVPASLDDYVPASLHNNTAETILKNITVRKHANEALTAKHPKLAELYMKVIEPRFQPLAKHRNHFIMQAVPFLYRAVGPQFVLELVGCFYDCNRSLFHDPRQQHMKEAEAMLESVVKTYAGSLGPGERQIYEELDEQEQCAFRICRDLALLTQPEREPLSFFMAFNQLANRLGLHDMQALRIMRQLEIYGLLKQLKKGTRREAGVRGRAGTYQWLLPPPQQTDTPTQ